VAEARTIPRWAPWVLLLLCLWLYLHGLGQLPLIGFSEGRYAAIGAEMWHSQDWLVPRYSGILHLEKPPLTYWAAALSYEFLGATEYAARLPAALAALGTILLTVMLGRRLGTPALGLRAGVILATLPLFLVMGRVLMTDTLLALGTTLYLVGVLEGERYRGWRSLLWALAGGLGLAAALLAKLHLVLLVAVLPLVLEAAWSRRGRLALHTFHPLTWLAMLDRYPGLVEWVLTYQTRDRVLTEVHDRTGPPWFYLLLLLPGLLPWTLVLPWCRGRGESALRERRLLWLWFLVPLLVFSCIGSKRFNYLPPILPPVALLLSGAMDRLANRTGGSRSPWSLRLPLLYALVVAVLLSLGLHLFAPRANTLVTWKEVGAAARPHVARGIPVLSYHLETASLTFYLGGTPAILVGEPRQTRFEDPEVLARRYFPDDSEEERARLDRFLAEAPELVLVCKKGALEEHLRRRLHGTVTPLHAGPRFVVLHLRQE
jgi:4-amino-4-deoxy-L-arabinose transferase-like glycosyltransferase